MFKSIRFIIQVVPLEIHPQTVHFPIAFIVGAFCSLIVYFLRWEIFYRKMGFVLHGVGSVGMIVAILSGKFVENRVATTEISEEVLKWHELGSYVSILIAFLLWTWMYLRLHRMKKSEVLVLILVYCVSLGSILYTAYLGGSLVYEYGIGTP